MFFISKGERSTCLTNVKLLTHFASEFINKELVFTFIFFREEIANISVFVFLHGSIFIKTLVQKFSRFAYKSNGEFVILDQGIYFSIAAITDKIQKEIGFLEVLSFFRVFFDFTLRRTC